MGPTTLRGTPELAETIKKRRLELKLTIEEAASRAGIGAKTWSRYEAGESIRMDKAKGVFRALRMSGFPDSASDIDDEDDECYVEYKTSPAWSEKFKDIHGEAAAASLAIGCDNLLEEIDSNLEELATWPRGTHLGEIPTPNVARLLPRQFLTRYDYEFLFAFRSVVGRISTVAGNGCLEEVHTVLEEIALLSIFESSKDEMEMVILPYLEGKLAAKQEMAKATGTEEQANSEDMDCEDEDEEESEEDALEYWEQWPYDILGDADVEDYLYSGNCLTAEHPYYFDHWAVPQFYLHTPVDSGSDQFDPDVVHMV